MYNHALPAIGIALASMTPVCVTTLVCVETCAVTGVAAQPRRAPNRAEARRLFQRGVALSEQQRWGEALEYLRRSNAIVERPSTVFNIGSILARLGHMTEAAAALSYFMRMPGSRTNAARYSAAQQLLRNARSSIARLELRIAPSTATVRVDGVVQRGTGEYRRIQLDPGRHVLEAGAPGYSPATTTLSVLPGEGVRRTVRLSRQVVHTAVPATPPPVRTPPGAPPSAPAPAASSGSMPASVSTHSPAPAPTSTRPPPTAPASPSDPAPAPDLHPQRAAATVLADSGAQDDAADGVLTTQAASDDSDEGLLTEPLFWVVVGSVAAAAVLGIGVGVSASGGEPTPNGGSTGVVINALQ